MSLGDPFTVAILVIIVVSLLGLPIGHAMIAGSILYLWLAGLDMGTAAEQLLNGMYTSWLLLAVPLFILSAEIMNSGSMTERLLRFCDALVGRFRGGLAQVNVVQSIIFAGMSGSAIADAAGSGKMMQKMMTQDGKYTPAFAAALTAASAVIGPIIPPSIPIVLYALIADTSIGYLFLAGVVPGVLMGLVQMALIAVIARRRNFPVEKPVPLREFPRITLSALPALLMPVVLLGGIYSGATTPTEAAAIAAAYALVVSVVIYRSVTLRSLYASLLTSARTTASIGMLIAGALVFNYVVTVENIPHAIRDLLATLDLSPLTFMILVNVLLLVLGCLLEGTTIILIVLPVLIPTAEALGIDLVYFGIVAIVNIMLGLITPPYGLLLFIMTNISGAPLRAIVRDTLPFLLAMIGALALMTLFPEVILWLPRLFGYAGVSSL
jgi:C4-dicarboxylate transporter DctM subunit